MHLESISTRVSPILRRPGFQATVESAFSEAVNLVTPAGAALALVSRRIGNGPLNAVVSHFQVLASLLHPGDTIHGDGAALSLGQDWRLALAPAADWDPHPDYSILARRPRVVAGNLDWLRHHLLLEAPPTSLAAPRPAVTPGAFSGPPASVRIQMHAGELIDGLKDAQSRGDLNQVAALASRLAGLGPGLTPAGDDWLAGWLLAQHLNEAWRRSNTTPAAVETAGSVGGSRLKPAGRNRTKQSLREQIAEIAVERTTTLSRALLACAAAGEGDAEWHTLLAALANEPLTNLSIYQSTRAILSHGATSGAAMLTGFCAGVALLTPDP